jgi:hypothetical protein
MTICENLNARKLIVDHYDPDLIALDRGSRAFSNLGIDVDLYALASTAEGLKDVAIQNSVHHKYHIDRLTDLENRQSSAETALLGLHKNHAESEIRDTLHQLEVAYTQDPSNTEYSSLISGLHNCIQMSTDTNSDSSSSSACDQTYEDAQSALSQKQASFQSAISAPSQPSTDSASSASSMTTTDATPTQDSVPQSQQTLGSPS